MNQQPPSAAPPTIAKISLLAAALAVAAIVYYTWMRPSRSASDAAGPAETTIDSALPGSSPTPDTAMNEAGDRILNEVGLPVGPPLPPAKAIPVKAAPNDIVGYRKDANGQMRPMKAAELAAMPANSPGTYAVVDMWADGGSVVVPPTPAGPPVPPEVRKRARSDRPERAN